MTYESRNEDMDTTDKEQGIMVSCCEGSQGSQKIRAKEYLHGGKKIYIYTYQMECYNRYKTT
jgi:hypothetical protein